MGHNDVLHEPIESRKSQCVNEYVSVHNHLLFSFPSVSTH